MVKDIRSAIIMILTENDITKYKLAQQLGLSTSSHINNYLSGNTKHAGQEVADQIYTFYEIKIEGYEYEEN